VTDSANIDLVRSIYAAWERGDYGSVEWADPDIEFVIADGPLPGRWTGLAGMSEGVVTWLGPWEALQQKADAYREIDDSRVFVLHHYRAHAKRSGLDLDQMQAKAACVFHIRDGKVARLALYWSPDRALADLGLAPEGGSPR
jgi:ketosteroid isomerase-like protein